MKAYIAIQDSDTQNVLADAEVELGEGWTKRLNDTIEWLVISASLYDDKIDLNERKNLKRTYPSNRKKSDIPNS